jgi:PhnB protein
MQFQPYLMFDGNCAQAMRFYEGVIGGKLEPMLKFSEMPEQCADLPAGTSVGDRIAHACLVHDGALLMASDTLPGQPYEGMKNFGVALTFPTPEAARKVFDALAGGGQVTMPLGRTFWAEAFGMVTDRFGTPWMVNGGMKAD